MHRLPYIRSLVWSDGIQKLRVRRGVNFPGENATKVKDTLSGALLVLHWCLCVAMVTREVRRNEHSNVGRNASWDFVRGIAFLVNYFHVTVNSIECI